uniref:Uncharacterized protein n=1 Tax=Noccaea caerulescens TaxID=107243 RepID=A0A1J3GHT7_NOCCA
MSVVKSYCSVFLVFHASCAAKNILKSSLALSSRGVIQDRGEDGQETELVVENLTRRCGDVSTETLCCLPDIELLVFRTLLKGRPPSLLKRKPELTGSCTSPPPPPHLIISTGRSKYNRRFSWVRAVVEAHEAHSNFSREALSETEEFEKDDALIIFFFIEESSLFGDLRGFCFPNPGRDKQKALHLNSSSSSW